MQTRIPLRELDILIDAVRPILDTDDDETIDRDSVRARLAQMREWAAMGPGYVIALSLATDPAEDAPAPAPCGYASAGNPESACTRPTFRRDAKGTPVCPYHEGDQ